MFTFSDIFTFTVNEWSPCLPPVKILPSMNEVQFYRQLKFYRQWMKSNFTVSDNFIVSEWSPCLPSVCRQCLPQVTFLPSMNEVHVYRQWHLYRQWVKSMFPAENHMVGDDWSNYYCPLIIASDYHALMFVIRWLSPMIIVQFKLSVDHRQWLLSVDYRQWLWCILTWHLSYNCRQYYPCLPVLSWMMLLSAMILPTILSSSRSIVVVYMALVTWLSVYL
jgi:hypothetical protein